jgi:hypothetical protein
MSFWASRRVYHIFPNIKRGSSKNVRLIFVHLLPSSDQGPNAAILFLSVLMLAELFPFFDISRQKTARNPLRNRGSCTKIVSKVQTMCTLRFQST